VSVAKSPKPETADPVASLDAKSTHVRAAAARDLSKFGTLEHLELLIARAHRDRSPAVRLGCAAAASDILSRMRMPPAAQTLSITERRAFVDLFRGFDPAVNSGLFPILACLGLPDLFTRIAAGLRDPRGDVRLGGAVGLLRMVSSASVHGDELMEKRVVDLLSDRRLKPDAVASVAQVCAAVGYRSALPVLYRLDLPGKHGEAVSEAISTFSAMDAPLSGVWFSDGRDAGEVNPHSPHGHAFAFIADDTALIRSPDGSWAEHSAFSDGLRRMFIRRVGEAEAGHALQQAGRTWYVASPAVLKAQIESELECHSLDWAAAKAGTGTPILGSVAERLAGMADETASIWRDVALLHALSGNLSGAIAALHRSVEGKRTPADTWLHLGEALFAQGKPDLAQQMWRTCVEKSRSKKAAYYHLALARLEEGH
jgi:hypothetical protein